MGLAQLIEHKHEMFLMLFDQVTVYKYIVKIYVCKSFDIILEDNSHELLKCSRSITVSLLHSMAHECAVNGGEHHLPHIFGFYVYLFICMHLTYQSYINILLELHRDIFALGVMSFSVLSLHLCPLMTVQSFTPSFLKTQSIGAA